MNFMEDFAAELTAFYDNHDWSVPTYYDGTHGVIEPMHGSHAVYIIEFDKGLIKVGQTHQFSIRLSGLRSYRLARGQELSRYWAVTMHDALEFESRLIKAAAYLGGTRWAGSREWFTGVSFDDLVATADRWRTADAGALRRAS